jgi:methyltransferase (TIGR00027 family)
VSAVVERTASPGASDTADGSGKAKRSAVAVAALRYAGSFERDAAVRNPDRLSGTLLPSRLALLASNPLLRRLALPLYRRAYPGAYEYHIARTRLIDELLLAAVRGGVRQVVILGAGLDTRAHRFSAELQHARVFEVDHPDTSRLKRDALAALAPVGNLALVQVDFDRDRVAPLLRDHGYTPGQPTFFAWEGVSMFIGPEAVDDTLGLVREAGPGSSIVFDYVLRSVVDGDRSPHGARQIARYLERGGEPWRFGLELDDVEPWLAARALACELNLGPAELEQRYLRRDDGRLLGRVAGFHAIAHASVPTAPARPR